MTKEWKSSKSLNTTNKNTARQPAHLPYREKTCLANPAGSCIRLNIWKRCDTTLSLVARQWRYGGRIFAKHCRNFNKTGKSMLLTADDLSEPLSAVWGLESKREGSFHLLRHNSACTRRLGRVGILFLLGGFASFFLHFIVIVYDMLDLHQNTASNYKPFLTNYKIYPICRHYKQIILSKDFVISMNTY